MALKNDVLSELKSLLSLLQLIPPEIWPIIGGFAFLIFACWWGQKRHFLYKIDAFQQLRHIKNKPADHQIVHLRQVNPFVFEEMVLTAIKRQGHQITRNKRYTGDGGIDGRCCINGVDYLIQAKRYSNHINPAHVKEFAAICKRQNKRGLFVHTGKTGAKSREIAHSTNLEMISGARLLNLLLNRPKDYGVSN